MTAVNRALISAIRISLRDLAEPARAPRMQAYMKSSIPYLGAPLPAVRATTTRLIAESPRMDAAEWQATVRALFAEASFREERYAAETLLGDRRHRADRTAAIVPLCEELIVTGAWWDHVDHVAIHILGPIIAADRTRLAPLTRRWAIDGDMWKRRSAIIHQVGLKRNTDTQLLRDCIEPNLADREFFIRKAIGWSLREFSKTDSKWVRAFIEEHADALSPLSRREGLKWISRGNA